MDKDGTYILSTNGDDGSALYINGERIVNNSSNAGGLEPSSKAVLQKGYHKIKVMYYDNGGGNGLAASMQPDGKKKKAIAALQLFL